MIYVPASGATTAVETAENQHTEEVGYENSIGARFSA
jgi:hypothetical protein